MSHSSAYDSPFKQILLTLEEEHHRVISQLCQQHANKLSQLHTDAAPPPMIWSTPLSAIAHESDFALSRSLSATGCDTMIDTGNETPFYSSHSFEPSSPTFSKRKTNEGTNVLQHHVNQHLIKANSKDKMGTLLRRYTMARGWEAGAPAFDVQSTFQKWISHSRFDLACSSAIFLNTALQGVITSFRASTLGAEELPVYYRLASLVFSCWFLGELILRWIADGFFGFFLTSRNLAWNLFDFLVVVTDLFDWVVYLVAAGENSALGNLSVMRMLRILRIARAIRVIKMVQFCTELRMMILSVVRSGRSLFWAMVLMSMIFYIFAIFLMQDVTEHLSQQVMDSQSSAQARYFSDESTEGKLQKYFGTLASTYYILFQSVSGGVNWGMVADALAEINITNAIVFCLFVFFTVFAMLNIITGFFVETSFKSVKTDNEEVIQEEMRSENSTIKQLHALFLEADTGKKGWITEDEFATLVEHEKTYALMKACGLHVSEVQGLFGLLDADHTGAVSIDDFIIGCMRLRGGAREIDLISLLYENKQMMDAQRQIASFVRCEFQRLDRFEERVTDSLQFISMLPDLLTDLQARSTTSSPVKDSI